MSLDISLVAVRPTTVFDANYTHNATAMAAEAGIYKAIWRPDEIGLTKAGEMIPFLRAGLMEMRNEPSRFIAVQPENGWGSYETFLPWVERLLAACEENPDADITVSR
jgi:hypothetical protein